MKKSQAGNSRFAKAEVVCFYESEVVNMPDLSGNVKSTHPKQTQ